MQCHGMPVVLTMAESAMDGLAQHALVSSRMEHDVANQRGCLWVVHHLSDFGMQTDPLFGQVCTQPSGNGISSQNSLWFSLSSQSERCSNAQDIVANCHHAVPLQTGCVTSMMTGLVVHPGHAERRAWIHTLFSPSARQVIQATHHSKTSPPPILVVAKPCQGTRHKSLPDITLPQSC